MQMIYMNQKMLGGRGIDIRDGNKGMSVGMFCSDKISFLPHDGVVTIDIDDFVASMNELMVTKKMEVHSVNGYNCIDSGIEN